MKTAYLVMRINTGENAEYFGTVSHCKLHARIKGAAQELYDLAHAIENEGYVPDTFDKKLPSVYTIQTDLFGGKSVRITMCKESGEYADSIELSAEIMEEVP